MESHPIQTLEDPRVCSSVYREGDSVEMGKPASRVGTVAALPPLVAELGNYCWEPECGAHSVVVAGVDD